MKKFISLMNYRKSTLTLVLEPLGKEYELLSREKIVLEHLPKKAGDELNYDLVVEDHGVSLWVNGDYNAIRLTKDGEELT